MVHPPHDAYDTAPLDPHTAPQPAYGSGALCDVIPAAVAGFAVPGMPATGLALDPRTGCASSWWTAWAGS